MTYNQLQGIIICVEKDFSKKCIHSCKMQLQQTPHDNHGGKLFYHQPFKEQYTKFSGIISKGLSVTRQKLIKQLLYGIQANEGKPACGLKMSKVANSYRLTVNSTNKISLRRPVFTALTNKKDKLP